ncbi:hypothetical protein [Streptosporangium sp. KLBMP 9127]|nr:hypothetical protein [Streptosporangium sp. KLBMP 9127]
MSRHFYRARWRGADYPAALDPREDRLWVRLRNPVPAEGFLEVEPGLFVRAVPGAECESIVFVTTVCRWWDEPFQVRDERDGDLLIEYVGALLPVAVRLGLTRVERGVHRRWVPAHEVDALQEITVALDR